MLIRSVATDDWTRIGELGEMLVRAHHAFDPFRFIHPDVLPAHLYTSRVQAEIARGHMTVLVADIDGQIAGYVFAGIEPESWKELRPTAGYIHDLVIDDAFQRAGIGGALVAKAIEWFDTLGVTRIMLWTASQNIGAQRLFHRAGFRPTMVEMTLDRSPRSR